MSFADSEEDGLIVSDKVGEPLDVCVPVSVGVGESEPLIELLTDGLVDEEALSVGEILWLSLEECDSEVLSLPDRELVWLLVDELLFVEDKDSISLSVELSLPLAVKEEVGDNVGLCVSEGDGLDVPEEEAVTVALNELLVDSTEMKDPLLDELEEGVAESDCVSEDVPLPESLAEIVEVTLNEALGVSDKEDVTLEDGVDVSQDDSLRELDDDPVLLGVPVELADGDSDVLDDPVEDAERLLLPEEVTELL